jgi:hypothetical protein
MITLRSLGLYFPATAIIGPNQLCNNPNHGLRKAVHGGSRLNSWVKPKVTFS